MDTQLLQRHFGRIGARLRVRSSGRWERSDYAIDIRNDRHGEYYDFAIRTAVNFTPLQVRPDQRHLLLLASDGQRFLCGHDERHWFVAGIADRVSTVIGAKQSLMPKDVREMVASLSPSEVDNRRNQVFRRQGEWFFIPVRKEIRTDFILRDEPLQKTPRNKPHMCDELYREGGELVYLVRNEALTEEAYQTRLIDNPRLKGMRVQTRIRNPKVYVRGTVRHADHSTVHLDGWHRVFMNAEFTSRQVAFLD